MSPQEGEIPAEEYHGEKEQRAFKAGKGEGSRELVNGDKKGGSSDYTAMQYQSPSFDDASNHIVSSPAPVVEKGGENEFVRVSHLASVQVKAVPALSILKNKSEKSEPQNIVRRISRRSEDAANKLRSGSNRKSHIDDDDFDDDSPCGEEMSHNDESSVGNLVEIEKSPYEPGKCAENGESIFEKMKTLLLENNDGHLEIVPIFGPTNAGCLVKASELIEISGMLYSQTWTKGSIRGNPVGIIPDHLLLMVLVPNRFVKAGELLLSGLCRDLHVYDSVNRGLDDWGWTEDYELVRATKKNYKFRANKRDCFKCAVFVARTHSCFLAFGKRELKPSLINKLKACLDIMEAHLVAPSSNGHNAHARSNGAFASSSISSTFSTNVKKRKRMIPDHVLSTSSLVSSSSTPCTTASTSATTKNSNRHQGSPLKRKRGGAARNSKHLPTQPGSSPIYSPQLQRPECEEDDSNEKQKESESSRSKRHLLQSRRLKSEPRANNAAASSTPRRTSSAHSVPSLHQLMSRFEDQYKEIGQRFTEMGAILTQMKTAIEDNRERSEKEIRRELLDDIQRNILESMPKR